MDASKALAQAAASLRELSEPHSRDEKIDTIIARCARLAGLKYSRCYEIYYGRARRIDAEEIARISEALEEKNLRDARHELSELRLRITKLEALFLKADAELRRPTLDQVCAQIRRAR
jgi:hypothetical protein